MNKGADYLRVTIHDRDYSLSLESVCRYLYDFFKTFERYPTEKDFDNLKNIIKHLWFATNKAMNFGLEKTDCTPDIKVFNPGLEFVSCDNIPDWDNGESVYIPMFNYGEVLAR